MYPVNLPVKWLIKLLFGVLISNPMVLCAQVDDLSTANFVVDFDSFVDSSGSYTHAANIGDDSVMINGVVFDAFANFAQDVDAPYSQTGNRFQVNFNGFPSYYLDDTRGATPPFDSQIGGVGVAFAEDGFASNPGARWGVTLKDLTPGARYQLRYFLSSWDGLNRVGALAVTNSSFRNGNPFYGDSLDSPIYFGEIFNSELGHNANGLGRIGSVVTYDYVPGESEIEIFLDQSFGTTEGSPVLLAFSNRLVAAPQPLTLYVPSPHEVKQRDRNDESQIEIRGFLSGSSTVVEARAIPMPGFSGTPTDWQVISNPISEGPFEGSFTVPKGWYSIETRCLENGVPIGFDNVSSVGVGDVFVVGGQSNSANSGLPQQVPLDPRVCARGLLLDWQFGTDPQPLATGAGGTPWPILGDLLAAENDVPIGFISTGIGGTRVDQWDPRIGNGFYFRIASTMTMLGPGGCKAFLWHQGESDNVAGTSAADYQDRLEAIIAQSRVNAGFEVPWFVALASYLPGLPNPSPEIRAGQLATIANDEFVFEGALTDDLIGETYRWDGIHFNGLGLLVHGERWFEKLRPETVEPMEMVVNRGLLVSGAVSELLESDNVDVSFRRNTNDTQARVEFELTSQTRFTDPSHFRFELEGSVFARSEVQQTIELFNHLDQSFEIVDVRSASRSGDEVVSIVPEGDLSRFVDPDSRTLRARVGYHSAVARQRFSVNVDQAVWTIGL